MASGSKPALRNASSPLQRRQIARDQLAERQAHAAQLHARARQHIRRRQQALE
jgi:hypothetical protein